MPAVSELAWVDGALVPREQGAPSLASSTFHMGTGVFDGIMAYWNDDHFHLHRVHEHLVRFKTGAARMDLPFPWEPEELEAGIRALLDTCPQRTHYIRPIAFRGAPEIMLVASRELNVNACIFAVEAERDVPDPMRGTIVPVERVSSRAIPVSWKVCGTYANSFLAQRRAFERGADVGVLLDGAGRLAEASTSNLFLICDEALVTPSAESDVFPGITRRSVLEIAARLGVEAVERPVDPGELGCCEGAFLASTMLELRPLSAIDTARFSTAEHPLYRRVRAEFDVATHA
ncbi:MAG TPA: aminotransferase class IV [Conexibacter sp.]|jgi:branched-chain amino acid aminotransferase|nr:aminotransferase class IV [Conexibacter sp.]